jgi:hypothetical protein
MTTDCAPVLSYADLIVTDTFPTLKAYANDAYQKAMTAAQVLYDFEIEPIPLTVDFHVPQVGIGFTPPPAPTRVVDDFTLPDNEPEDFEPTDIAVDDSFMGPVPREPDAADFVYREPGGEPGALTVDDPGTPPVLADVTLPTAPTDLEDDFPERPEFYELTIPEPPTLLLDTIEFEGERPEFDFDVPPQTFAFVETAYSSQLLDDVTAQLSTMLQGGTGLPAAIEQALFDRSRGREDLAAAKLVQEATEEWSHRGFEEPPGMLTERLLQVRQANQNAVLSLNRDLTIRVHEVEIENLRFAVVQCIALEQVQITAHLAREERRFQAARYLYDSALAVFNARVALHNARVQAYQVDAQVYRERLQAELTKVEAFRAEIEGQKAIGEINKALAERYEIEFRGVLARVEIYVAQVNAARVQIEANGQRIEAYRALVQAFGERVRAYEAQWNGFRAQVEARLGSVRAAEISAQNYATRVRAWGDKANVAAERARTEVAIEEMSLRAWDGTLRKWLARVEAERTRIGAQVSALGADATVYGAAGQLAIAASAAVDRHQETEIARARTEGELYLRQGEIRLQQHVQINSLELEALRGAAQTVSQQAASSLAALNVHAGVSSSASNSTSCSHSTSLTGELET